MNSLWPALSDNPIPIVRCMILGFMTQRPSGLSFHHDPQQHLSNLPVRPIPLLLSLVISQPSCPSASPRVPPCRQQPETHASFKAQQVICIA